MIVVADGGPLNYLILIEAVDVLKPLYQHVVVPQTVADELQETTTPATVRAWIAQPPKWCEILPDPSFDPALKNLDPRAGTRLGRALVAQKGGRPRKAASDSRQSTRNF
jgi:hypothetical protein